MMNLGFVGSVLYLVLMGSAMAAPGGSHGIHGEYGPLGVRAIHRMPAQDYDHFVFGIARPTYHSGWGGPYGDGEYPGTVEENMGPPNWERR